MFYLCFWSTWWSIFCTENMWYRLIFFFENWTRCISYLKAGDVFLKISFPLYVMQNSLVSMKIYRARLKECVYYKIQQYLHHNLLTLFLHCIFILSVHISNAVLSYRQPSLSIVCGRACCLVYLIFTMF